MVLKNKFYARVKYYFSFILSFLKIQNKRSFSGDRNEHSSKLKYFVFVLLFCFSSFLPSFFFCRALNRAHFDEI